MTGKPVTGQYLYLLASGDLLPVPVKQIQNLPD